MLRRSVCGVVFLVIVTAVGVLGPGHASAAGTSPRLGSGAQFDWGESVIEGSNFTPGGPVAVYVYNAGKPNFPLVGVARTVATRPLERCNLTGCRRYPGGEISVLVFVDPANTCWQDLWTYAVDEAGGTATGWIFAQHYCPFQGE